MIFSPFLLYHYVIHVVLHFSVHHVMKYGSHGALIGWACNFQLEGHHCVVKFPNEHFESSLFLILQCHPNLIVPTKSVHKGNMAFPTTKFISRSMLGNRNLSLGQTQLRFLKSTQHCICLFFFFTGTMLDNHCGC